MSFRDLVLAALDAADIAPDSAAGRYALDRVPDVGLVVQRAPFFAIHYGARRLPRAVDPQDAALSLAMLATTETARGVRTVGAK